MKTLFLIAVLVLSFGANDASAKNYRRVLSGCMVEDLIYKSSSETWSAGCKEAEELKLTSGSFYYPLLRPQTQNVKYWTGSFLRSGVGEVVYYRLITNICDGGSLVLRDEIKRSYPLSRVYELKNPNLDRAINESFRTLPMTPDEATKAFADLKTECEN